MKKPSRGVGIVFTMASLVRAGSLKPPGLIFCNHIDNIVARFTDAVGTKIQSFTAMTELSFYYEAIFANLVKIAI